MIKEKLLSSETALTMVELICVIALITILIGLAVPSLYHLVEVYHLEAAQQQLFYHMRLAKMQAAKTEELIRVSFEFYGETKKNYTVHLSETDKIYGVLPDSVEFYSLRTGNSTINPEIVFQPDGIPWGGATIGIRNRNGDTRYIIIAVATGRIRSSRSPPVF